MNGYRISSDKSRYTVQARAARIVVRRTFNGQKDGKRQTQDETSGATEQRLTYMPL